jgi:hypothetical protein
LVEEKEERRLKRSKVEKRTGFAYSSAPGNDRLVTDTLGNRLKEALSKSMFGTMNMMMEASENPIQPKVNQSLGPSTTGTVLLDNTRNRRET